MSGHSVGDDSAIRAVKYGKMTAQYGDVRVYEYDGGNFFVPERLWSIAPNESSDAASTQGEAG